MTEKVEQIELAIIGAGAAGIFCALNAADLCPDVRITVIESTQSPLAKVRVSGGGRCNVTHHCFDSALLVKNYPRGAKELRGAFARFQPQDTVAWFAARGVDLKVEADGRMFPVTDSSQTVIDCFLTECQRKGIKILKGDKVMGAVGLDSGKYQLELKSGKQLLCRKLVIATGSAPEGHQLATSLGHTLTALAPSLFTFKIEDRRLSGFAGLSFGRCHLVLSTETARHQFSGPLLITHWGLSGPAVLKISAFAAHDLLATGYRAELKINFLAITSVDAEASIQAYAVANPKQQVANHSVFTSIPQRWWGHLCAEVGIDATAKYAELKTVSRNALADQLTVAVYQVSGKGVFKEEFVTAGGVTLSEVDFRAMESKLRPGLFFAGEVLDIDGITGGFNFQNAWTTAMIAARAISQQLHAASA